MALFAVWRATGAVPPAADLHRRLRAEAHVVADHQVAARVATRGGDWQIAAFATDTRYHRAADQVWIAPDDSGACIFHGLVWRLEGEEPRPLDAAALARLLDRPGRTLPDEVCGEYAILRLHGCGAVEAFGDPAGLHHLFHDPGHPGIVANRAGFVAALRDDWRTDPESAAWLTAIGYRVGTVTGYRGVRQVAAGTRLTVDAAGQRIDLLPNPIVAIPDRRGLDAALFEQGLTQAKAAVRLATAGDDRILLPITGGKDSRAVLALCLAAGLRDRLTLFTRGLEGHVDVIAGRGIAAACGLPHERQPPLGSDLAPLRPADAFLDDLAAQAYQTDGMMGGWDLILGRTTGTDTLLTGHMGELLKAYSKRPLPDGALDPVAMVRLQAPFDPLDLLRPDARATLVDGLHAQMAEAAAMGALMADQPDIFYARNRIPNWLGGIRGIKAFERQPVMPLGVPAFLRLAFAMTPDDRKQERVHYEIVRRCAPDLIAPPFALQRWDPRLDEGHSFADPILPGATTPPVFGTWQYSLNHVPRIRAALLDILAGPALPLWEVIDPDAVRDRLRNRAIDYFGGISLLGLVAAALHDARLVAPVKLGPLGKIPHPVRAEPVEAPYPTGPQGQRPPNRHFDRLSANGSFPEFSACSTRPFALGIRPGTAWPPASVTLHGHVDAVHAKEQLVRIDGWIRAPDFPTVRVAVQAVAGDRILATAVADRPRPDLVRAGLGDGAHGFTLAIDGQAIAGAGLDIVVTAFDGDGFVPVGGRVRIEP